MKTAFVLGLAALSLAAAPLAPAARALAAPSTAASQEGKPAALTVGDPAPPLADVEWIQGGPHASWQPGQIYVIDFWATWCGPCRASIPHVNELAATYRDRGVNVIGAAIWPRASMVPTAEYVEKQGEAMSYAIAADVDGKTAASFMATTLSNGIPTAMIVDREGRLAWIGHPMAGMDAALEQIVAGVHDLKAATAADVARRDEQAAEQRLQQLGGPILKRLKEAQHVGEWAAVVEAADRLLELDPTRPDFATSKYDALLRLDDAEGASRTGRAYVTGPAKGKAGQLNYFAWWIVDPTREPTKGERDLDLALLAAEGANTATEGANPSILDTLARVHFLRGDAAMAAALQRQAVELTPEDERADLQATLDTYLAAAEG